MRGIYDEADAHSATYRSLTKVRSLSSSSDNGTPWRECATLEGFINYHQDREGGTEEFKQWLAQRIN